MEPVTKAAYTTGMTHRAQIALLLSGAVALAAVLAMTSLSTVWLTLTR
jgi:hypothetical protein